MHADADCPSPATPYRMADHLADVVTRPVTDMATRPARPVPEPKSPPPPPLIRRSTFQVQRSTFGRNQTKKSLTTDYTDHHGWAMSAFFCYPCHPRNPWFESAVLQYLNACSLPRFSDGKKIWGKKMTIHNALHELKITDWKHEVGGFQEESSSRIFGNHWAAIGARRSAPETVRKGANSSQNGLKTCLTRLKVPFCEK